MQWMRACRLISLVCASGLTGCAAYTTRELANPTPLHREPTSLSSMADMSASGRAEADRKLDDESVEASRLIAQRYYAAMAKAKTDSSAVAEYVKTGTTLVQLHCLRWFGRVAEAQRNMELGDTNRNVISQLGTALIGIGRLHSDVTAVYGGLNTAIAGLSSNFGSAFLAAPNAESVKRLVMEALRSRAALLTDGSPITPKDFSSAYLELEKLADTCTYAEVKKMTTESVDKSKATADPDSGEIKITAADLRFQAANENRVMKLLNRVDALTPEQALALAQILPFRNDPAFRPTIALWDPGNVRAKDPKAAKDVAKRLITQTANSDFRIGEWESALSRFD